VSWITGASLAATTAAVGALARGAAHDDEAGDGSGPGHNGD
jgi:hypothetical protein